MLAGVAGAVLIGMAPWFALRGIGMGRLSRAIDLASRLQAVQDPSLKLLLEVRYYSLLRREHFPSRFLLSLGLIGAWLYVASALLLLAVYFEAGIRGWTIAFCLALLVSLMARQSWSSRFAPDSRHMLTHRILAEKEEEKWEDFLEAKGYPANKDDFEQRIKQRERRDFWLGPAKRFAARNPVAWQACKGLFILGAYTIVMRVMAGVWLWNIWQ